VPVHASSVVAPLALLGCGLGTLATRSHCEVTVVVVVEVAAGSCFDTRPDEAGQGLSINGKAYCACAARFLTYSTSVRTATPVPPLGM
jgi:hypothetical protein